jgi:hypothetical protein
MAPRSRQQFELRNMPWSYEFEMLSIHRGYNRFFETFGNRDDHRVDIADVLALVLIDEIGRPSPIHGERTFDEQGWLTNSPQETNLYLDAHAFGYKPIGFDDYRLRNDFCLGPPKNLARLGMVAIASVDQGIQNAGVDDHLDFLRRKEAAMIFSARLEVSVVPLSPTPAKLGKSTEVWLKYASRASRTTAEADRPEPRAAAIRRRIKSAGRVMLVRSLGV